MAHDRVGLVLASWIDNDSTMNSDNGKSARYDGIESFQALSTPEAFSVASSPWKGDNHVILVEKLFFSDNCELLC